MPAAGSRCRGRGGGSKLKATSRIGRGAAHYNLQQLMKYLNVCMGCTCSWKFDMALNKRPALCSVLETSEFLPRLQEYQVEKRFRAKDHCRGDHAAAL